ncbi:MAG: MFS transporter [Maricaulaceae bacterium]
MSAKLAGKLFTQKRFLPLFVLFQAGTFNDNALKQALIGLVTYAGLIIFSGMEPKEAVPIAALFFTMPFLILCAISGQIADKFDRGLILKVIKRVEVFIMILAAVGFWFTSAPILCAALALMGAQSSFLGPTKNAVLPYWLKDDELITANGLLSGFQFFMLLLGQVFGLLLVLAALPDGGYFNGLITGPRLLAIILLVLAFIGWIAGENVPPAPAPMPDLKVDYNPITATFKVLKFAWQDKPVFRPLLGIAWFYGLSAIFITAFPSYVKDVLGFDQNVLTAILAGSTVGILVGALLCVALAKGKEAMGLVTIGIIGIALFSLDICFNTVKFQGEGLGTLSDFFATPGSKRLYIDIVGASMCNGLFLVPLQAMAQIRSDDTRRARLMAGGAVMYNFAVNFFTFALVWMGAQNLPDNSPFWVVVIVSTIVAIYAVYRFLQIRNETKAA